MTDSATSAASRIRFAGRFLRNPLATAGLLLLALIALSCIFAGMLSPNDPNLSVIGDAMLPPFSPGHPLGTDSSGRDVLSRLLHGGRVSLLGACLAIVVAAIIGIPTGMLAGYYGSWFDSSSVWWNNLIQSMPGIVVLLAARAVMGPSIWLSMFIYGIILSPAFYRVVRTAVIDVRNELYVDAARVAGLRDTSIIGRHILAVVRAPVIIQTSLLLGIALAIQSGLEFIGIGDPTIPSWGNLLNDAFKNIYRNPAMLVWPTLAIGLTCAALVVIGNGLRDALEERGSRAGGRSSRRERRPSAGTATAPAGEAGVASGSGASGIAVVSVPESTAPGRDQAMQPVASDAALLSVRGVSIAYGDGPDATTVVRDASFDVSQGEVLGLVGESGSGKTQTAFSILGLLPAGGRVRSGSILFDGQELGHAPASVFRRLRGTELAYIPQEPMSNLDPSFRIGNQLVEPIVDRLGVSKREATVTALELLSRVGIPEPRRTFDAYPHEISGGMAQRVLIAGAVSCKPRLLIADEPTTALDVTVQAEVLDLLRSLQKEYGMGIVLVTHNFGVVADICDRVAVMRGGAVVEVSDVQSIFADPRHEYTRMLLDSTLEGGLSRPELDAAEEAIR
ncbi:dipeptide/oligopeptide/nickel ABC transporter permease/ATP-binding protein [Microbacterium sp. MYb64]|uniref:dipeptide/oligopeptide/nickel ABC transporter permease/ATP-binding protein n=1 Tax=Microbacterium sp. MYb64 TaxID=1848691 RepID=UPI000CFAB10E|nr:dipeptide/oligopeptide/nickel ABC transporter permease/ATP-binding protein [Microbacterium sp. MYb64]PRB07517.1 ABC transporter [Microbacterium sp. MYb64]